uniref:Thioredoxin domain-containing protein C13F5.05, putative n=1 Tax=Entamoeba invadens TaxID=33085 RepID=S0B4A5_ENTIV|nr:thioredoxin domain-containing protein C13F5.05, putative [Entamoeba invadens]
MLLLLLATLSTAHFFGDAPIFMPTKKDLPALESSTSATILMLYAPWCGHCKHLAPEFAAAAKEVNGKAIFAAVDCEVEKEICGQFGVQGFPTVKLFSAQKTHSKRTPKDYNGPREAKAIIGTMYDMIPDWVNKLPEKFETENNVILFSDKPKRTLMLKSLAMHFAGVLNFYDAQKENEEAVKRFGVTEYPSLFVEVKGEIKKYEGKLEMNAIMAFLSQYTDQKFEAPTEEEAPNKEEKAPEVPFINLHVEDNEMFNKHCGGRACMLLIFGDEVDSEMADTVAENLKDKMHVTSFHCAEQSEVCKKLNVFFDTPTAIIYVPQRSRIVRFVGGFDVEDVTKFGKEALLGKSGRIEMLKEFPAFMDRVKEPYVKPVIKEEL